MIRLACHLLLNIHIIAAIIDLTINIYWTRFDKAIHAGVQLLYMYLLLSTATATLAQKWLESKLDIEQFPGYYLLEICQSRNYNPTGRYLKDFTGGVMRATVFSATYKNPGVTIFNQGFTTLANIIKTSVNNQPYIISVLNELSDMMSNTWSAGDSRWQQAASCTQEHREIGILVSLQLIVIL